MKKLTLSKEQSDAFLTYMSDNERGLYPARYRLDRFSESVEKGELPPAFLAFEILDQLALADENGFTSNQYLNVVPAPMASKTVEVPKFVLNRILNCWDHFIHSDPTKASLEKSFGFAAPKPNSNPIQHVIDQLDKDRYLASQVLTMRMKVWSEGKKLKLLQAFADVAANENVSNQTVKSAWYKHRSYFKKFIREMQLPPDQIG
jgi:hypothetical protein